MILNIEIWSDQQKTFKKDHFDKLTKSSFIVLNLILENLEFKK